MTFFSYKGGVGRTMALANVGFTAAMNGMRVLLMDWDLEAPGLSYYFRGLIDHEGASEIRRAPGVLNLFWDWDLGVGNANSQSALQAAMRPFINGDAFRACVRPLVQGKRLPTGGTLDVIGAGSPNVNTPDPTTYANALSQISWSSFFEHRAGGVMIGALRDWCRRNYDLILVDSRTGLADVAGICTMQLPDDVVLCFVLNRQNMEGVAQVASSIIGQRGNDINVRVAPMRVSKERPTEEADARARAQREFRRAQLPPDRIEIDMTRLAVPATANVPFYETLAPFAATDASLDPLTLAYLGLTQELLGRELLRVKINPEWVEDVRRRLEPRLTTVEYLRSLEAADPDRALDELDRYLDGALDADPSLELDRDYVQALVKATFDLANNAWEDEARPQAIAAKAVELLKQLHSISEGDWRIQYVSALDQYNLHYSQEDDVSLAGYLERDGILTKGEQTFGVLMLRVGLRVERARVALIDKPEEGLPWADEAERLLDQASLLVGSDADQSILISRAAIADIRTRAFLRIDPLAARKQAQLVLEYAAQAKDNLSVRTMAAEAHLRLGMMPNPPMQPIAHLMAALEAAPRIFVRDEDQFEWASKTILAQKAPSEPALYFLEAIFGGSQFPRSIPFARTLEGMARFARILRQLVVVIGDSNEASTKRLLRNLTEVSQRVLLHWMRRAGPPGQRDRNDKLTGLVESYQSLAEAFALAGVTKNSLQRLMDTILNINSTPLSFDR